MPARLNRRRYREAVTALKEIIGNPKTPAQRRLRAIETLLGIYDRHDRTEARKEAAKRVAIEGTLTRDADTAEAAAPESTEEKIDRFLALIGKETVNG